MLTDKFAKQRKTSPKATPESKRVKHALNKMLEELKPKRNKKSLAMRNLLLQIAEPSKTVPQTSPYMRNKRHHGTEAALKFMEEVSVPLPGKKQSAEKH